MMRFGFVLFTYFFCVFSVVSQEIADCPKVGSIEEMLDFAGKHLRRPYRAGAEGPYAFDCSGFTRYCYKQLGITLNRSSIEQKENGERVRKRRLKPGDLVFFKGSKGRKVGHVGIVVEKGDGKSFKFIHASTSSGIIVESGDVEYFKKRYKTARRITTDRKIRRALKNCGDEILEQERERERIAKEKEREKKRAEKLLQDEKKRKEREEAKLKKENERRQIELQNKREIKDSVKVEPAVEADAVNNNRGENAGCVEHVVVKGDTLYNISKRYGCTVEDIQKWNGLADANIALGQTLFIKK